MQLSMEPLPIDPHLPEIISLMDTARALVVTAPPGTGKTTRIPRALYDAGFAERGEILILEPRRLAARLASARVAQELGEKPGETVGYSIRFENVAGPDTRIRFLTEAILARRILQDPVLGGVSAVILDEFHERHLATDLALAFLRRLLLRNEALKVIVMSATLDAEPVVSFLPDARLVSLSGSPYDVSIEHEDKESIRPLHEKVASAVSRLFRAAVEGDVLVFLPGSYEIRRSTEALEPLAGRFGFSIFPLHGDLPSAEQNRAIGPSERKKVILSTNVAETSLTIPGISAVIDSGLARVAGHSPWSGFPTLATMKISRSSAVQRAGRAGRTQAGRVLRLYSQPDFESRPEHEIPEIKRADLTETALMLHGAGTPDVYAFPWFESPPKPALEAAEALLLKLGAVAPGGRITADGTQMLRFPIHPRLARLITEGVKLNAGEESVLTAALLSERDIRAGTRMTFGTKSSRTKTGAAGLSDILELLDRFQEAEAAQFHPDRISALGLDPGAVHAVRRAQRQLQRLLPLRKSGRDTAPEPKEEGLLIAVLAAFPDRVAKRRKPGSPELLLAGGGTATLSPSSVVHNPQFSVAVDAEERRAKNPRDPAGTVVRLASAIEVEWLAGLFPEAICETTDLIWNERAGRVDQSSCTYYDQVALEEKTVPATPSEQVSSMLASVVLDRQLSAFRDASALPVFQARLSLLAANLPEEHFSEIGSDQIREAVELLSRGKRSLGELEHVSLIDSLAGMLTDRQRSLLGREAPEKVKLKAGRMVKIHYEQAKPPWIESRLQDFFGMATTPAVCAGRVPLTIHLLAPNGRAVQITRDLSGFWERHYPSIRKELQRRYPRHAWPEL
jgi:ATP-dependent helicase HrpB